MNLLFFQVRLFTVRVRLKLRASVALSPVFSEIGCDIKSLSEILGHSNTKITLDRYVHSSLELKRANMMKLAEIGY